MRLPNMKYMDGITKKTQVKFGGLNHSAGAKDGELWDMKNLTGDHYPLLATRSPRRIYRHMDAAGSILTWDALCWVDSNSFYYDGEYIGGDLQEGRKTLAAIGSYIVIFPDKRFYNVDTKEYGALESFWNGEELEFRSEAMNGIEYKGNCLCSENVRWADYFKAGDAVTIGGCQLVPENNKTAVILDINGNRMFFDENTFLLANNEPHKEQVGMSVSRTVPDLRFLCENENRLWGCTEDRIFACGLGDPFNWNNRSGLDTDGYDVDTGSAGEFTGCISYQGYPTFFKEDHIYKVYGSLPSDFQLMDSTVPGIAKGSSRSLAIANSILFYLSRNGVMAYTGGIPQFIGNVFGLQQFCNAVAGSDGMKYYISMQDGYGEWGLYIYNTQTGLWFKEDDMQAAGFSWYEGNLYMLCADGSLLIVGNVQDPPADSREEGEFEWYVEFADFTEEDSNVKGLGKIQIRLELEEGAKANVLMMFDSDGQWIRVGDVLGEGPKRSYYLPVVPHRADHYRMKIEGTGGCRIYSLTRESYSGAELSDNEGRK